MNSNARVMLWCNYRRGPSISVPSPFDGDPSVPWWYDKIAHEAHQWAAAGYTDVLFPSPLKTNAGAYPGADGYGPFDDYDIGSKDTKQFGGIATRFGTAEKLRRAIAICHANGLQVHIDHVMHQRMGGHNGVYRYLGADGKTLNGRFPKDPGCFRGDPKDGRVPEDPVPDVPDDFSFGDELCPINAKPKGYVWDGLIDAGNWIFRTLGIQGARLDDMKGMAIEFMKAWMSHGAMASKFFFGEYASGNPEDLNWWCAQVGERASLIDFGFHYNRAQPMCNDAGGSGFWMTSLGNRSNAMLGTNPMKALPFVESMDSDTNGFATIVSNKALAYALLLTGEGLPMVYVRDYLQEPDCYGLKPIIDNLLWIARNLANGSTVTRYGDRKAFVFERTGDPGLLVALNNDVWNPAWHTVTVQTGFGPNVRLHDYTGHNNEDCWTDANGRATFGVPPGANGMGFGCWSRAGLGGGRRPPLPQRSCTQEFFGAEDLDIMPAINGELTVARIWVGAGTLIAADFAISQAGWTTGSAVEFHVLDPAGDKLLSGKLVDGTPSGSAKVTARETGWHSLYLVSENLPAGGNPFTYRVNYTASPTLLPAQF